MVNSLKNGCQQQQKGKSFFRLSMIGIKSLYLAMLPIYFSSIDCHKSAWIDGKVKSSWLPSAALKLNWIWIQKITWSWNWFDRQNKRLELQPDHGADASIKELPPRTKGFENPLKSCSILPEYRTTLFKSHTWWSYLAKQIFNRAWRGKSSFSTSPPGPICKN